MVKKRSKKKVSYKKVAKKTAKKAVKRVKKVAKISYKKVAKKAARKSSRRKSATVGWKGYRKTRPVIYATSTGLTRSPYSTIRGKKINPRKYKRRSNPLKKMLSKFNLGGVFNKQIFVTGFGVAGGMITGRAVRSYASTLFPNTMPNLNTFAGVIPLALGAIVLKKAKRPISKNVGYGLIAYGVYDIAIASLAKFAPTLLEKMSFLSLGLSPEAITPVGFNINPNEEIRSLGLNLNPDEDLSTMGFNINPGEYVSTMGGDDYSSYLDNLP
jgi:hypothetical protein